MVGLSWHDDRNQWHYNRGDYSTLSSDMSRSQHECGGGQIGIRAGLAQHASIFAIVMCRQKLDQRSSSENCFKQCAVECMAAIAFLCPDLSAPAAPGACKSYHLAQCASKAPKRSWALHELVLTGLQAHGRPEARHLSTDSIGQALCQPSGRRVSSCSTKCRSR